MVSTVRVGEQPRPRQFVDNESEYYHDINKFSANNADERRRKCCEALRACISAAGGQFEQLL